MGQQRGLHRPEERSGQRDVPICEHLRAYLVERSDGFYFGSATRPFDYDAVTSRAYKAWEDAGLQKITLHECRHTFRSYLDAIPTISETRADRYAGHSVKTLRTRYTHTLNGQLAEDAAALDEFLSGAETGKIVQLAQAV